MSQNVTILGHWNSRKAKSLPSLSWGEERTKILLLPAATRRAFRCVPHASEKWMNGILRQELGFRGVVESEGGGFGTLIYEHIVRTQKEAGALALKAGVDLDITYEPAYMGPLIENVEEGRVPIALVDRAVRRVLELKFRLGLFENPYVDVDRAIRTVHSQPYRDLALRAGREGIVLLKNERNLLPLKKNLKSIAVIGPDAENVMNQLGDYSPHKVPQHVVTILEGI